MVRYGQALLRSSSIYAVGVGILVPLGLISLAVTTRYLEPAEFGRLTILFAAASLLTIAAGIGVLQGTLMLAYQGGADDEDGDDDVTREDVRGLPELTSAERKRVFTSGVLLSAVLSAAYAVPLVLFAGPISSLLLGDDQWAGAVRWMAASVWAGSIWRLVHQVWRYERRPQIWVFFQTFRPVLVIALSVAALATGNGISGVLAATAVGTLVTILISIVASRRNFDFRPRLRDGPEIMRRGMFYAPVVIASMTQGPVAVFVVAAFASAESVGIFQVAAKLAMVPAYFGDGVMIGWPVLRRGPLGRAAVEHRGLSGHGAFIFKVMALSMLALLVLTSLFVDILIHIAADDYAAAADLVPLLAAGAVGHVLFRAVYRTSRFPFRRTWYIVLHFAWIAPYTATIVLLPTKTTWSVATAAVVANTVVTAVMVLVARSRGKDPTPYPWVRLGLCLVVGIACVLAVDASGTDGALRAGVSVLAALLFPVGLVAVGALPRGQVLTAADLIFGLLPRRASRTAVEARLREMTAPERRAFVAILWGERAPAEVAAHEGVAEEVVLVRLVRALRAFEELPRRGGPTDVAIAKYLLHAGTTLERDDLAEHLGTQGVAPYDLARLDAALVGARRVRRRARRALVPLDPAAVRLLAPVAGAS
jgi:O-antigen/teichoic acid export membrane protein